MFYGYFMRQRCNSFPAWTVGRTDLMSPYTFSKLATKFIQPVSFTKLKLIWSPCNLFIYLVSQFNITNQTGDMKISNSDKLLN